MASLSDSDVSSSISVTALSDGLYHIKWAFDISSIENARGSQETTFRLDQYSSAFYKLTLKYYKQDPEPDQCECSLDTQFMVNLKLKREAYPTSQWLISMDGRDQSAAVWARVGRCQKIILDQLPYIVWKSETFPVTRGPHSVQEVPDRVRPGRQFATQKPGNHLLFRKN
ncbi:hypothetical protein OUZ56_030094 [Daphnia magna]|uniref:Uncharacterized protein n=1 Tax=Daphnia magna TaxID=35525 RepID=A0ABQ9ZQA2_9CRUS|nr:hypothetical protein OUZ56_030094 [Daphnia magna]